MSERLVGADEARVLRENATPGPWSVLDDGNTGCRDVRGTTGDTTHDVAFTPGLWNESADAANARLIAAAPDLAATVEALHAEVADLRRQLAEARDAERDAVVAYIRGDAREHQKAHDDTGRRDAVSRYSDMRDALLFAAQRVAANDHRVTP